MTVLFLHFPLNFHTRYRNEHFLFSAPAFYRWSFSKRLILSCKVAILSKLICDTHARRPSRLLPHPFRVMEEMP